jgi:hypothetical protein
MNTGMPVESLGLGLAHDPVSYRDIIEQAA